jgi:hypothetical protein
MLLAILRIFPRRSFELSFFGEDDGRRFLLVGFALVDAEDLGVVESCFLRLGVDDVGSK